MLKVDAPNKVHCSIKETQGRSVERKVLGQWQQAC